MMKMALPLSGSNEGVLLGVESNQFGFYIKGKVPKTTKLNEGDFAHYEIIGQDQLAITLEGICEEEVEVLKLTAKPLFFEQMPYEVVIETVGETLISFDHDSSLIRNKITPLGRKGKMQSGVINFGSEVGLSEFRLFADGKLVLRVVIEVYPTKLSYKSDYLKLQEEVTEEIYNLAFDFMRKTYQSAGIVQKNGSSLTELFSIYKQQYKELRVALGLISYRPYHQLVEQQEILNYKAGMPMTKKGIAYLNKHPQQLIKDADTISAKKLLVIKKQNTIDVYENQVVKFMLEQILRKLKGVKTTYEKLERQKDEKVLEFIREHIGYIEKQLGSPFFRGISKLNRPMQFSMVIQMSPVYRKFYKVYLMLQRSLSLSTDLFQISHKNIAELYEYWCFIKLGSLLRKRHELKGTDIIKVNHRGLYVSLKKGRTSTMSFIHRKTGETFTLSYNRKLNAEPTVAQKPDNMLMLKKEMSNVTYQYVLDAKYKLGYEKVDEVLLEVPKEEDINTIHRYRDAIVSREGEEAYQHEVFGGVILFPGSEEMLYQKHRFYESINKVNIGGLPFLPSKTQLVEEFLENLVQGAGHEQYHHVPFISGIKEYLTDLQIERKNVLIGPIKSNSQLKITLEKRLYHVPQKALKVLNKQIETIVLYEPKGKEDMLLGGGIRYEGKVKSAVAMPRKELADLFPMEKDNGEEIYITYEVSSWEKRKEILRPSRYAPVRGPRYSNTTLLRYAKTLPELYIRDELEFKLILHLRRCLEEIEVQMNEKERFQIEIKGTKVFIDENSQIIVESKKGVKKFDKEILMAKPREIYRYIIDLDR